MNQMAFAPVAITPRDVGLPVPIKVSHALDRPARAGEPGDRLDAEQGGDIHKPDGVGSSEDVAPEYVALAVTIEVTLAWPATVTRQGGQCGMYLDPWLGNAAT